MNISLQKDQSELAAFLNSINYPNNLCIICTHNICNQDGVTSPQLLSFLSNGYNLCFLAHSTQYPEREIEEIGEFQRDIARSLIDILNKYPTQVCLGSGVKFKTELCSYGGKGYVGVYLQYVEYIRMRVRDEIFKGLLGGNILRMVNWWKYKPKEEVVKSRWLCDM